MTLSKCSDVEPHSGVGQDTGEGDASPQEFVSSVSFSGDSPLGELLFGGSSWQKLTSVFLEVYLVQHKLAGLFMVGQLREESEVEGSEVIEFLDFGSVRLRVFSFWLTTGKNTLDGTDTRSEVLSLLFIVIRNPSSVNKNCSWLSVSSQVSVQGSNNLNASFATVILVHLEFCSVVEVSSHLNRLHGPLLFELVQVLGSRPGEGTPVLRSNVNWGLSKSLLSTLALVVLIVAMSALELSQLVHEHYINTSMCQFPLSYVISCSMFFVYLPRAGAVKALNAIFFVYISKSYIYLL